MQFLRKRVDTGKVPNGLRIHYQEIHLMDSPSSSKTRAAQAELYKKTEENILSL